MDWQYLPTQLPINDADSVSHYQQFDCLALG